MDTLETNCILNVIQEGELERATKEGWELVERYQESTGWNNINGESGGSTQTYFMMKLNEKSSLALITEENRILEEKVKNAEKAAKGAEQYISELKYKVKHEQDMAEELRGYLKETEAALPAHRQMEADMGKIQEALGTQRMNEIIKGA